MENKPEKKIRKFEGIIISDKMDKTRIVRVDRMEKIPKYEKYHRFSKKFKAHDEKNKYHAGDKVVIEETRPISRDKRWVIVQKIA